MNVAEARQRRGLLARLTASLVGGLGRAVSRFPIAVLAVFCLSVAANLDTRESFVVGHEELTRIMLSSLVAACISIACELFLEASGTRRYRQVIAAVVGLAAGLLMWAGFDSFLFYPPVVAFAALAIPLAPHLRRSNSLRFWMFANWTIIGCTLAFLSVLLFCAGGTAIIEMVRYLLDFELPQSAYRHIVVTALSFIGPLFAMGRIPTDFTEEPVEERAQDRLTIGFRGLLNWVATPLVLIGAIVLHIYVGKIIVTGDVPKNQIGWIVTTFALFVLTLPLAAEPFIERGGAAIQLFGRCWLALLPVPLALLAFALALRIEDEGFTNERYYLVVAAVAVAIILLLQILPRFRGDIRWMAMTPVALLVLSSFGPLGSAATVTRSQSAMIAERFAPSGTIEMSGLSAERQNELRSRIQALHEVDGVRSLLALLPSAKRQAVDAAEVERPDGTYLAVLSALGLQYGVANEETRSFSASMGGGFAVEGFDHAYFQRYVVKEGGIEALAPDDLHLGLRGKSLVLRLRSVEDSVDLGGRVSELVSAARPDDPATTAPRLFDVETVGGRALRLQVRQITVGKTSGDVTGLVADIAIRSSDWTR